MKNIVLILFVILIAACQQESNFKIIGQLPDNQFNGETIYLVPIPERGVEWVDSTTIQNGQFMIEGYADSSEIYVLRAQPLLRAMLQELLVVRDPGVIMVNLGANSTAAGTALNDSLQRWKAFKIANDKQVYMLNREYSAADTIRKTAIKAQIDSLMVTGNSFYSGFTQNNQTNVVGRFVKNMLGDSFQSEQTKDRE